MMTLALLALTLPSLAADPPPCDEFTPGTAPAVVQDDDCINTPPVGTFTPVVEWQWDANPLDSDYVEVMMTPVVGNLTDDDGDGQIDTDDTPDIAFTSYIWSGSDYDYRSPGALVVISGDGSDTWLTIEEAGGYPIYGAGGVAIGDLEGDGSPDICVAGASNPGGKEAAVICLEHDGTFKWAAGAENYVYGCPAIADMDGDGLAEVVHGREVFDFEGNLLGTGGYGDGRNTMSFPVDWDGDGALEVVAGNAVYEIDGSLAWTDGGEDGIPAVGDFDGDQKPDLVKVTWGEVVLTLNDGTEAWRVTVPGGGNGGPPTVADFDGDGLPEVGVAGYSKYGVIDTDGDMLWTRTVQDYSSSVTGSSVFDFEGDGQAEVVYADEWTLWVFDGPTGDVLMEEDSHSSRTLYEYPVIADVDGDDSTEIVVISNTYGSGTPGVTVIGDADDSWFPARPIWNQHAYHITNVDNDGGIPLVQAKNWLTWNNFRAGGTELGPSHWMAQLYADTGDACATECEAPAIEVYLPISNAGLLDTAGITVAFYRLVGSNRVKVHTQTVAPIAAGDSAMAGPFVIDQTKWGSGELMAVIDDPDDALECDETDNEISLGLWPYPASGDLWDNDGDGYVRDTCGGDDCDDYDPSIYPGAEEISDDGIDQDCDGDDRACDKDGDGYLSEECGGNDCDDDDPSIHPHAEEIPGDGIDQDCDGEDRPRKDDTDGDANLRQTCGCLSCDSTGGTSQPLLFALLGLGVLIRRRRR